MRTRLKPKVSCDTGKNNHLTNTNEGLPAVMLVKPEMGD